MKRLSVAISHHGFGHLAQTAPVLAALHDQRPDLQIVLASGLPHDVIAQRVRTPFEFHPRISDCNFVMHDSVRLDLPASLAQYQAFHQDWQKKVADEADWLAALQIDAVFSNVGYLPLAGAARAGIPALAMCSLNWADLFEHYLVADAETAALHQEMLTAYRSAAQFLQPTPAMSMPTLANARSIAPIAERGTNQRRLLADRLNMQPDDRVVIVGLGGIPHRLPVENWPRHPGLKWLVPDAWHTEHPDVLPISAAGMRFVDLLASVDALVTKPGYGSFVEAVVHGVPVLYLPRPDWPEAPALINWLARHGRAQEITVDALDRGEIIEPLEKVWAMLAKPSVEATGAIEAAGQLLAMLD